LAAEFDTIGEYAFAPAAPNLIAAANTAGAGSTFNATYLANIAPTTASGNYNAVLTYTAVPGF
jgi:hypothetical protein